MRTSISLASLGLVLSSGFAFATQDGFTERVSISSSLGQGNGASGTAPGRPVAVAANGRVVAFLSTTSNLVLGDTNGVRDAFVRDLDLDLTDRVSVSSAGVEGNGDVQSIAVSATGRWVAFSTEASNHDIQDLNGQEDIYLRDRESGTTSLVSRTPFGFAGNGTSQAPSISDDGRFVAFWSSSSSLVAQDSNGVGDVFVFDRIDQSVTRVSVASNGSQLNANSHSPSISAGGRYVVFVTTATNLGHSGMTLAHDIAVHDRLLGTTTLAGPNIFLGFSWNDHPDKTSISEDGRYIAFESEATNVVLVDDNEVIDVFVWDRQVGAATLISHAPGSFAGNGLSRDPLISADGSRVIFESTASDLVPGDSNATWDIFVTNVQSGVVSRVSVGTDGGQANALSGQPALSGNGARVAFTSGATNLVAGDTNVVYDVFARLVGAVPPLVYCSTDDNSQGCAPEIDWAGVPSVSAADGFRIEADELLNNVRAFLIYSTAGPQEVPFGQQFLCMQPPIRKCPVQFTGGTAGHTGCTGTFSFDFNEWMASGIDPSLTIGTTIWTQIWSRDPAAPSGTHLTAALTFVPGP